ncbi:MAG TPA: imidazolonepropionase, partial [Acidimicrobiales bacterium]
MTTRVIKNIGELTTNDPTLGAGATGRLHNAAMVIDHDVVLWVGPNAQAPAADEMIDARDCAVIPGFVDSHTHLVFAGERSDEFEARMSGTSYDGGGIVSTVNATRAASSDELRRATQTRLRELRAGGVTTVEIKSGYALDVDGESRLIDIANQFSDEVTFLGAHVVPREYAADRGGYVNLVRGPMLAACAPKSKWADVFCDRGAFDVDESREILTAARSA